MLARQESARRLLRLVGAEARPRGQTRRSGRPALERDDAEAHDLEVLEGVPIGGGPGGGTADDADQVALARDADGVELPVAGLRVVGIDVEGSQLVPVGSAAVGDRQGQRGEVASGTGDLKRDVILDRSIALGIRNGGPWAVGEEELRLRPLGRLEMVSLWGCLADLGIAAESALKLDEVRGEWAVGSGSWDRRIAHAIPWPRAAAAVQGGAFATRRSLPGPPPRLVAYLRHAQGGGSTPDRQDWAPEVEESEGRSRAAVGRCRMMIVREG